VVAVRRYPLGKGREVVLGANGLGVDGGDAGHVVIPAVDDDGLARTAQALQRLEARTVRDEAGRRGLGVSGVQPLEERAHVCAECLPQVPRVLGREELRLALEAG